MERMQVLFFYRQIYSFGKFNVEEIVLLHEGKFFKLTFRYAEGDFDKDYINQIKDHMINSIKWIGKEKVKENSELQH